MAEERLCSFPGCNKPIRTRGWCSSHYQRWLRSGDPAGKHALYGDASRYLETVVLRYTGTDCLLWPFNHYIRINGRSRIIFRVVCERTRGSAPSPRHHAAHSCGNGHLMCVNPHHLSWKTPRQNEADKLIHGTRVRGEKLHLSKLTEREVLEIKSRLGREKQRDIACSFNISESVVSQIKKGKSWSWLT